MPSNSSKTDALALDIAEQQRKAVELRKTGASYDQIAKALGYTHRSAARKSVARALERIIIEPTKDLIQLEMMRLDELMMAHWGAARTDPKRAAIVLSCIDRRARYMGLADAVVTTPPILSFADWASLRAALLEALEPYPEAHAAVVDAMKAFAARMHNAP